MKVEALIFSIIGVFCIVAGRGVRRLVAGADRDDGARAVRLG